MIESREPRKIIGLGVPHPKRGFSLKGGGGGAEKAAGGGGGGGAASRMFKLEDGAEVTEESRTFDAGGRGGGGGAGGLRLEME
eukprot:111885-Rhodomonas_salina.3